MEAASSIGARARVPAADHDVNSGGIKVGELANVGTAAAIANAVHHATGIRARKLADPP